MSRLFRRWLLPPGVATSARQAILGASYDPVSLGMVLRISDLTFAAGHGNHTEGLWFHQIAPDSRFEVTTSVWRAVAYELDRERIAEAAFGSIGIHANRPNITEERASSRARATCFGDDVWLFRLHADLQRRIWGIYTSAFGTRSGWVDEGRTARLSMSRDCSTNDRATWRTYAIVEVNFYDYDDREVHSRLGSKRGPCDV